jgi:mannonate dehydratase
MKPGLGLYRGMLTQDNFRFARQVGAEAIVAHLADYFQRGPRLPATQTGDQGWGVTTRHELWTEDELRALRLQIEAEGLELAAIENFELAHWYDVLLDGPRKREQLEQLKTIIRRVGAAGIPVIGYNFSLAAVWGWTRGPFARGGAESVRWAASALPEQTPIPAGMVWNMVYDLDATGPGVGPVSEREIWARFGDFLEAVIPVAEEAGVRLAIHPEDPPVGELRGTSRLAYSPEALQRVMELVPSPSNAIEFCQGAVGEMEGSDLYAMIDRYTREDKIAYVHFRNVRGRVPDYTEVFIDEGDTDMLEALRIYRRNGFTGVIIPDHTPQMRCDAPWHAGMAYALGYMRAAMRAVELETPAASPVAAG